MDDFLQKLGLELFEEEPQFSRQTSPLREPPPAKIRPMLLRLSDADRFSFKLLTDYTDWHSGGTPTMGVSVRNRRVQFYYNQEFLDSLTDDELRFIIHHELLHIVLAHQVREKISGSGEVRDHELFNIAADSIINQMCNSHALFKQPEVMPERGYLIRTDDARYASTEKEWQANPDDKYEGSEVAEALYAWMKTRDAAVQKKEQEQQGKGGAGGEDTKPGKVIYNEETGQYGKIVADPVNGKVKVDVISEEEAERLLNTEKFTNFFTR